MKRLLCLAALTAVLSASVTAFADDPVAFTVPAEYVGGTSDTASVDATDYSTVLITKDEEDGEIVYIDQADDVYNGVVPFLVKTDPAVGKYKVTLGSETGTPYQTYFYVGVDPSYSGDIAMTRLQNEELNEDENGWNIGYYAYVDAEHRSDYNSLKIGYAGNDRYGGVPLEGNEWDTDSTHYSGSGELYIVFQLNDVPSYMKDSVTVFLSPEEVSDTKVNNN